MRKVLTARGKTWSNTVRIQKIYIGQAINSLRYIKYLFVLYIPKMANIGDKSVDMWIKDINYVRPLFQLHIKYTFLSTILDVSREMLQLFLWGQKRLIPRILEELESR